MKVQWEESDILPGRRYVRSGLLERWMIGYLSNLSGPERYVHISLADGMVTAPVSKAEMAQTLTQEDCLPIELMREEAQ